MAYIQYSDLDPAMVTDSQGNVKHVYNADAIGASIKNFILTSPGDRFMECWFGFGISDYIFSLTTQGEFNRLSTRMKSQIESFEPRAKVQNISVNINPDTNEAVINLAYSPVGLNEIHSISLDVSGA